MTKSLNQLVEKYDAATVFVGTAAVIVIFGLLLMRTFVPSPVSSDDYESGLLMEQVYSEESVAESSGKLLVWKESTEVLVDRFTVSPELWQKDLQCTQAFGFEHEPDPELLQEIDELAISKSAADYAVTQLYLQSIMTGNNPLANINGNIYRIGDDISLRGGEINVIVAELGSDFAVVFLAANPEIKRTIYLSDAMRLANGEDVQ
jgi:hypothetical protein